MNLKKIYLLFSALIITFYASCTFNEPLLPNWETIWDFPFPDISYEMSETADNEYIVTDTTNQGIPILKLSIRDSVQKEGINQKDLSIKPENDTLSTTINNIKISSPGKESTEPVQIEDLLGFSIQPGDNVTIPPNTTVILPSQMVTFSNYKFVMINSGKLIIEFHNQTFLDIDTGMQIDIFDDSTNQFLGTSVFSSINAYTSKFSNDSLDVAGKLISDNIRLEAQIPLVPQSYTVTPMDTSGYIQNDICISNLIVNEAIANIPTQSATKLGAESVEDRDNRVIEAVIDQGEIRIEIENQLAVEALVTVRLPNFLEQSGVTFNQSQLVSAHNTTFNIINLDGLKMYNFESPGTFIDSIYYEVTINTTPSTGLTYISNEDSVIVNFDSDSILFREFQGEIDTVDFIIDTVRQTDIVDYNGFDGNISLNDLELNLTIFNEIGIPADLVVFIRGERRNPDTMTLERYLDLDPIPIQISAGQSGMPSINTVSINNSNSNIVELMEILPTDIVMNGSANLSGVGRVALTDSIWGEYQISSPFNLFVDSIPDFISEIEMIDGLDEDIQESIENRFQNANLELNYENGLPVETNVTLIFATDSIDFFILDSTDTNKIIIDDFNIQAGTLGPNNFVSIPFKDQINSELNADQVKLFAADTLYFGSIIKFPDNDKTMKFRSSDAFIGKGSIKFKVYMNPED